MDYEHLLARTYDAHYALIRDPIGDREHYAAIAAERGGPILEIGCGTGRVLLPIARSGLECVGVDPSSAMLAELRAKDPPPSLALHQGHLQTLDLPRRGFSLAIAAFRVLQHLVTVDDQLEALTRLRDHLRDDGWLALDVFEPNLERMARDDPDTPEEPFEFEGRSIIRNFAVRRDRTTQTMAIAFRYVDAATGAEIGREHLALRWIYRYELEHLLWRAGFEPLRWSSGYDGRPYDGKGDIVVVARRR
ncbi:MAG: class I SAM-dependent methyltransferase [Nannocystaceae bacterium]